MTLLDDLLLEVGQMPLHLILLQLLLIDLNLHIINQVLHVGTLVEHSLSLLQLL